MMCARASSMRAACRKLPSRLSMLYISMVGATGPKSELFVNLWET
jgi:hypothetical protein